MIERRTGQHFELRILPRDDGYALAIYQTRIRPHSDNGHTHARVVEVWGEPLKAVIHQVLEAVRRAGHRASDLTPTRKVPFRLREEDGVRLGLLFLAVKPLRKLSRIEAISDRVKGMEPEELFYWYSKSTATDTAIPARRALRILMSHQ